MLTGTIHKWIGSQNKEHGEVSLYSFSWLNGGRKSNNSKGLVFEQGASFFISAFDSDFLHRIVKAIQNDPVMFCGLAVSEIIIQNDPDLTEKEHFQVASPVFIKRAVDNRIKHFRFDDKEVSELLKETILTKMQNAGITDSTLEIDFDKSYSKAKQTLVHYGDIKNKANICPVIIKAKPETKTFIWNVGLGNSTGVGFGALK